jgi:hypothetical protein
VLTVCTLSIDQTGALRMFGSLMGVGSGGSGGSGSSESAAATGGSSDDYDSKFLGRFDMSAFGELFGSSSSDTADDKMNQGECVVF